MPVADRGHPGPDRVRWAIWLIAALGVAYLIAYGVLYFPEHSFDPVSETALAGGDFWVFWTAARLAAEGRVAELYDLSAFSAFQTAILDDPTARIHPFPYPPHALFLFRPLAALPYGLAFGLWIAVTGALFLWAAVIADGRAGLDDRADRLDRLALLLGTPVVTITVFSGQTGLLTAALFVAGFRLLERRPVLAGILFGLLTFKPHLGLLIPVALVAAGQWRAIGAAAAAAAALGVLSAAVFGPALWADYGEFSAVMMDMIGTELAGADGTGFAGLQSSVFAALHSVGAAGWVSAAVQAAACAAAAVAVYQVYRSGQAAPYRLPLLIALTFLASPYVFFYDMPLLAFAVVVAGREMVRTGLRPGDALALTAAWLLPVMGLPANAVGVPVAPLFVAGFALIVWRRVAGGMTVMASGPTRPV